MKDLETIISSLNQGVVITKNLKMKLSNLNDNQSALHENNALSDTYLSERQQNIELDDILLTNEQIYRILAGKNKKEEFERIDVTRDMILDVVKKKCLKQIVSLQNDASSFYNA